MVLQQVAKLVEDVRGRAVGLLPAQVVVRAHDLDQLVREVVLAARARVHHHRRPHGRRRHGQHADEHPVGAHKRDVKP